MLFFKKYISSSWESFLYIFSSFLLGKLVDFVAFLCPDLSSTGKYFRYEFY